MTRCEWSSDYSLRHIFVRGSHSNIYSDHSTSRIWLILNILKNNNSFQVFYTFWSNKKLIRSISQSVWSVKILRSFTSMFVSIFALRSAEVLSLSCELSQAFTLLNLMKKCTLRCFIHNFKNVNCPLDFSWDSSLKLLKRSLFCNMEFAFFSLNFESNFL